MWRPQTQNGNFEAPKNRMDQLQAQKLLSSFKYRSILDLIFKDDSSQESDLKGILGRKILLQSLVEIDEKGTIKIQKQREEDADWEDENEDAELDEQIYEQMFKDMQKDLLHERRDHALEQDEEPINFNKINCGDDDDEWIDEDEEQI